MKRYYFVLFCLVLLSGCGVFRSKSPTANVYNKLGNETQRLEMVGALSQGVGISLKKEDIPSAEKLNNHISAIAETPTPAEIKLVIGSLENKEKEQQLEKQLTQLIGEKRKIEIAQLHLVDSLTAKNKQLQEEHQQTEEELKRLQNPVTAIFYGIKTLIMRSLYILMGGGILFFVLRTFAASNPIVGSIFSIFEHIVAFLIKGTVALFPKSSSFSGQTSTSEYKRTHHALSVIIDAIEIQKLKDASQLENLLITINKNADNVDKNVISEIKKSLNY